MSGHISFCIVDKILRAQLMQHNEQPPITLKMHYIDAVLLLVANKTQAQRQLLQSQMFWLCILMSSGNALVELEAEVVLHNPLSIHT